VGSERPAGSRIRNVFLGPAALLGPRLWFEFVMAWVGWDFETTLAYLIGNSRLMIGFCLLIGLNFDDVHFITLDLISLI
jgi:hypothetical protein